SEARAAVTLPGNRREDGAVVLAVHPIELLVVEMAVAEVELDGPVRALVQVGEEAALVGEDEGLPLTPRVLELEHPRLTVGEPRCSFEAQLRSRRLGGDLRGVGRFAGCARGDAPRVGRAVRFGRAGRVDGAVRVDGA